MTCQHFRNMIRTGARAGGISARTLSAHAQLVAPPLHHRPAGGARLWRGLLARSFRATEAARDHRAGAAGEDQQDALIP